MWSAVEDEKLMAAVTRTRPLIFKNWWDQLHLACTQRNRYARCGRAVADDARTVMIPRRRNKFTRAETLVIKMAQTLNRRAVVYTQVYKCSDPDKIKRYAQLIRNEDMILQNPRSACRRPFGGKKVLRLGV